MFTLRYLDSWRQLAAGGSGSGEMNSPRESKNIWRNPTILIDKYAKEARWLRLVPLLLIYNASQTYSQGDQGQINVGKAVHLRTEQFIDKPYRIDLPPTTIAQPLPVSKSASANGIFTTELSLPKQAASKKRKRKDVDQDDTPKAFLRLMAFQQGKRLPKGLDDGVQKSTNKKRKRRNPVGGEVNEDQEEEKDTELPNEIPKIKPGERMSEFAARVDVALPVAGLINKTGKTGKDPLGLKKSRTRTEKKMHKMNAEWREQDKKLKEKRDEEQELFEEMAEDDNGKVQWKADLKSTAGKKKGKKRRQKMLGELDDGEGDPWAVLRRNRGEVVKRDINDVVKAPPTFANVPREKFKRGDARVEVGDVPKASGSLRRREELGEMRRGVVGGYRAMMKDR